MEAGVLAGGVGVGQTPVLLDPFDRSLDNANQVVIAPAGAGKSFFCKLLALRQLVNSMGCVVVDPEGEYRPLAEAVGGQSNPMLKIRGYASASVGANSHTLKVGAAHRR
jgi:type IV secretory pathway VirB4 component